VFILNHMAASIATAPKPAGPDNCSEKALGAITATFLKDANDPAWKDEQASKDWQAFIEKYNRAGGKDDNAAVFGYAAAETLAQVLKQWAIPVPVKVMKGSGPWKTTRAPCCCPGSRSAPARGIFGRSNTCG
jgi:hypothetical protein